MRYANLYNSRLCIISARRIRITSEDNEKSVFDNLFSILTND